MLELLKCPLCCCDTSDSLLSLSAGNFSGSSLYEEIKVASCFECGHIYNKLTKQEVVGLVDYYNKEYSPITLNTSNTTGDLPGSKNKNTYLRHNHLIDFVSSHIDQRSRILDIGCALGGLLHILQERGFTELHGIDMTEHYVTQAKLDTKFVISQGQAESIPYSEDSFELLFLDQVLEHTIDPRQVFIEAKRVLIQGGYFCIGVPDAARYKSTYFFDYFWFLMREHIQHFDLDHLQYVAELEGFELVDYKRTEHDMVSASMVLPNLNVLFKLKDEDADSSLPVPKARYDLRDDLIDYFSDESKRLNSRCDLFNTLSDQNTPLYFWGIGREFTYLYENLALSKECISGLIDTNEFKQRELMVDGLKISSPALLDQAKDNSAVVITAVAHTSAIKQTLAAMNFKGTVLEIA